jgi:DNA polymerase
VPILNLNIDTETYSTLDLRKVGGYKYTRSCECMIVTYAIGDGPTQCWDRTLDPIMPEDLNEALNSPKHFTYTAHNALFDRNVIHYALGAKTPIENWRCTMVKAYTLGLPGSLDQLGLVLNLPIENQKIADGKKLIQRFCKPSPRNHKVSRYTRETHPDEWARFIEYAIQDIDTIRIVNNQLPD